MSVIDQLFNQPESWVTENIFPIITHFIDPLDGGKSLRKIVTYIEETRKPNQKIIFPVRENKSTVYRGNTRTLYNALITSEKIPNDMVRIMEISYSSVGVCTEPINPSDIVILKTRLDLLSKCPSGHDLIPDTFDSMMEASGNLLYNRSISDVFGEIYALIRRYYKSILNVGPVAHHLFYHTFLCILNEYASYCNLSVALRGFALEVFDMTILNHTISDFLTELDSISGLNDFREALIAEKRIVQVFTGSFSCNADIMPLSVIRYNNISDTVLTRKQYLEIESEACILLQSFYLKGLDLTDIPIDTNDTETSGLTYFISKKNLAAELSKYLETCVQPYDIIFNLPDASVAMVRKEYDESNPNITIKPVTMPGREFMMRYLLEDSTNSENYLLFILNGDKDLVYGIRLETNEFTLIMLEGDPNYTYTFEYE